MSGNTYTKHNVYLLDLEYLQQIGNYLDEETFTLVERTVQAQLEPLSVQPLSQRQQTVVIGTLFWEYTNLQTSNVPSCLATINQKVTALGAKFHLVSRTDYESQLSSIPCPATFIDFFALRTHQAVQGNQELNLQWQSGQHRTLFLMGKYYKPHRLGLLHRLYQHGLLTEQHTSWSLYQTITVDEAKKYVPQHLQNTLGDFLNVCHRHLDNIKISCHEGNSSHYGGFPFDAKLYKTTNLSLISETTIRGKPFVTEKTYRAIINHHPFVVAGPPGQLQFLQNAGFYTFDEFMKFPAYDNMQSVEFRLDAIAENVKHFNPSGDEIEQILKMIEQNAEQFYKIVDIHSAKLQNMLASYGIYEPWENIIPWKDNDLFFLSWQFYYQKIKGPSWPPCYSIEDCNKLPQDIQHELATVFNLKF